jgi:F0F1-type ATP synthase membrane subunit b/b'
MRSTDIKEKQQAQANRLLPLSTAQQELEKERSKLEAKVRKQTKEMKPD